MATTETASPALGPRYAPDDPTLPKPWLGLIDGGTGTLYYWNPETNVTQYDKPVHLAPPVPAGSAPNLAPIPGGTGQQQQGNHFAQPHGQQMPQQQSPHVAQGAQQQPSQSAQPAQQQQNSQLAQPTQQPGLHQARPQMMQPQGQQMMQYQGQQFQQMHHQVPPQGIRPQQFGQGNPQDHGTHIVQPQAPQFTPQNMHYMGYQQNMITPSPRQPNSQQVHPNMTPSGQPTPQHNMHNQPFENQQDFKPAIPKVEEAEFKNGSQVGFSPSQYQQRSSLPVQNNPNIPAEISSGQVSNSGVNSGQPQQFRGFSGSMQQPTPTMQSQQGGSDLFYQHAPNYQNQMSPGMMHGHPSNAHPAAQKMGHEDNVHGRAGNDYYYNSNKEMPPMGRQQSDMAQMPISRNQQDMRIGNSPFQNNVPSGNGSGITGNAMGNMFTSPIGGPPALSSNSFTRPPYGGSSDVTDLSPAEIYCRQHEVTATGDNIPPPFMTFDSTGFPPEILQEVCSAGFSNPTPIQAQTWPIALQGRDIVAIAKTGSGKTLGYLMPAFILLRQRRNNSLNGPTVLVLAPTRELATQIQEEVFKFARSSRVSCTCLYGGAPKALQLKELDRGADIVVATPGRLNDILDMKKIDFRQVSLLVLDEADRMLDMGFEPQIRKIVNEIPPHRQTLMYTATWPKEVRKIAGDLLVNPVQVNIGNVDELAANKSITQYVEVVPQMEKQRRLEQILRSQERGSKIIIFCSTKKLCDQLARSIGRTFGAAAIHGDKSQGERDYVLGQFRNGKSPILVATDVAARGLDIKDIRVVINFDFPNGVEDYVHRIGRTGRAGATGMAYTFFSEQDWKHAGDLIKVLEGANQHVLPELRQIALRGPPSFGKDRGGMTRFDSGSGGGRWEPGGRGGMRDGGGFGPRGGMRDGGSFGGGFGGRGSTRDGGSFGSRGGMRDGPGGQGERGGDFFPGRGNRGRGFGPPRGGHVGWGRGDRGGPSDRYNMDGRGQGRGRGRFDNRRDVPRSRDRSYSRSPERVRTWDINRSSSRSRSRSRSWSRGRSRSRSWSRGRSRSYSRSPRRSHSRDRSYSRSRSPKKNNRRVKSKFSDKIDIVAPEAGASDPKMSPISANTQENSVLGTEHLEQLPVVGSTGPDNPEAVSHQAASDI
ncbi:hypothetical protein RYX36_002112 [Vicia faba]